MNLNFSEAEVLFREEVKSFLDSELTADLVSAAKHTSAVFTEKDVAMEWQSKLVKKGWLVPSWPEEYGGTNWTETQKYIFSSECAKAGAPNLIPMGLAMIGPLLLGRGTKEQKDYYIPRIISGEDYWCQGYSEPGAGSDLASLQCRAVRQGDQYVINGTKIWTTHAHLANKIFCLVRTDNSGKKQQGITFLMLDMDQPGVKVEPILTMAQDHDFNQVVFTDAIANVKDRIGEENDGWSVAKYLLEFERSGGVGGSKSLSDIEFIRRLIDKIVLTHNDKNFINPYLVKVAELEIKAQAIQYTSLRILSSIREGDSPGPESSMMKTLATDLEQEISELTLDVIGYYGIPFQDTSFGTNESAIGDETFRSIAGKYQNLRATTIYGGSNEIQRNIMAKAVLGL
ncbi:acyl-CoA dehydrogenase family protein [Gammaproteobacteria bacterium]|nr:acyl-CoA dehydrogenase family protein [Gammaproteobacteria bacterium]|tara:strand:- start:361 stop:1557 length:1197 start_codon:yes stop_codon:yes gene_type:complete